MANLAIRGVRGNINNLGLEVIRTLEMLGGVNKFNLEGNTDQWYVLDEGRTIRWCEVLLEEKGFTLEEFIKKFPYKVGDRVRVPEYESEVCISKMYWDGNEVQYEVVTDEVEWYSAKELNEFNEPNKEPTFGECIEKTINECLFGEQETMGKQIKIDLPKGYEFAGVVNGKVVFEKIKYQYPKNFKECCEILGCKANDFFTNFSYDGCDVEISEHEDKVDDLLHNFRKLIYCRNAYWKLVGEEMGLGKPWEPDWRNSNEDKYCIEYSYGRINSVTTNIYNYILAFPTAEMRDTFLENFGYLIELCKELL